MPASATTRLSLLGLAALSLIPCAGAQLTPTGQPKPSAAIPATAPTAVPMPPPPPTRPSLPGDQPAKRAVVTFTGGLLTVKAENSSLNQILRAIAQQTGMKITGGVTDERVYGTYGPGSPDRILNTLLDGTGSNMLLVESAPAELILTPRHGGVTPPNPNAGADEDRDQEQQERPREQMRQGPDIDLHGGNPPVGVPQGAAAPVQPALPAGAPASSGTSTTTDQSPNGVKTPQQVFEQLMQMQQKKSGSTGN